MMQISAFHLYIIHGDSEDPTPYEAEASLTVTVKHYSTWDVGVVSVKVGMVGEGEEDFLKLKGGWMAW